MKTTISKATALSVAAMALSTIANTRMGASILNAGATFANLSALFVKAED